MAAKPKRTNGKASKGVDPTPWRNRIVGHGEEDPEQLLANPKNWRIHPKPQQDALSGVLSEVGWVQEVIVNQRTGFVVDGHLRVSMAISRGEKVPVIYVDLDEAEEAKVLATIDPLSAMAVKDEDLLKNLIGEVETSDPGLQALLEELAGENAQQCAPVEGEDDAPPPPEAPVTVLGDLWLCGPHRVLCGDSTASDAVSRLLSPASGVLSPFLMVTDPPYGVEYDPEWRDEAAKYSPSMGNRKDTAKGKVQNDDRIDWTPAWDLFPGDVAYCWHAGRHASETATSLFAAGFQIRNQIIWAKSHIVIGRGAYHWQHEPCWYAVRKGRTAHWCGDRTQSTLWSVDKPQKSETGHGTQKPVELMRRPILNHTTKGEAVYDPFLGSGTTLVAAEQTGRICYGLEIDPKYVDVIVRRYQDFTGKEATLDGDGRTFREIAAARGTAAGAGLGVGAPEGPMREAVA